MRRVLCFACLLSLCFSIAAPAGAPTPPGRLIDVGGFHLHLHCEGAGLPTVVIENGFDEFSTDWEQVQTGIARFTRVCTYDRAGYAWSESGPLPRTYAQINLELHTILSKAGEQFPLLLVGHSFGGPVIRNYAKTYRGEAASLIFAESVGESHRIVMGKKTEQLLAFAQGRNIPAPHAVRNAADSVPPSNDPIDPPSIEPPFDRLSRRQQQIRLWALSQPSLQVAEASEREWSPEYFALWAKTDQRGTLGSLPVVVLARRDGGFADDLDLSAAELERQRRAEQEQLAALSSQATLHYLATGHEIEIEAPDAVVATARSLVMEWRADHPR